MAVSATKTYVTEVLVYSDLNLSFTEITDQGEELGWEATKAKDMNGQSLVMDADADSRITASTDDRIDLMLGGSTLFRFDGTATNVADGLDFVSDDTGTPGVVPINATGGTNVSINLISKGTGVNQYSGNTLSGTDESQWVISKQVYGG